MKVLQVLGSLHRGGAETMIMNYYRAFDRKLCQFDFVIHAEFDNDYRDEAKKMGANIILLKRPGELGILKYIAQLKNAIGENGPYDAVHIHTNYQAFLGVIAAKKAGINNIVVHSHTTSFTRLQAFINRIIIQHYNVKTLACGKAAGDAFFGKKKYEILNNAIDAEKFLRVDDGKAQRLKNSLFRDKKVIGHIGRFHPPKNHAFLISIAEKIISLNPNVVFALYGEGDLQEEIKELIKSKGLQDKIQLMGVTDDVITVYHMFDLFILPSLWEGFPVTLIEAQLAGVMSLASDKVSRECDLGAGLLEYLPLEINTWVTCMQEALRHSYARKKIDITDYDVNVQWKKLYELYKNR